jgi:hypothetical protein
MKPLISRSNHSPLEKTDPEEDPWRRKREAEFIEQIIRSMTTENGRDRGDAPPVVSATCATFAPAQEPGLFLCFNCDAPRPWRARPVHVRADAAPG